jgi:hypothetical protein
MLLPPLVPNILFFHYSFKNSLVMIKYLPEITTFVKLLKQNFGEPMGRGAVIRGKTSWNLKPA